MVSNWQLMVGLLVVCVLLISVASPWSLLSTTEPHPRPTVLNPDAPVHPAPAFPVLKATAGNDQRRFIVGSLEFESGQAGLLFAAFVAGLLMGLTLHWGWSTYAPRRLVTPQRSR